MKTKLLKRIRSMSKIVWHADGKHSVYLFHPEGPRVQNIKADTLHIIEHIFANAPYVSSSEYFDVVNKIKNKRRILVFKQQLKSDELTYINGCLQSK